jgi:hypothetical protein
MLAILEWMPDIVNFILLSAIFCRITLTSVEVLLADNSSSFFYFVFKCFMASLGLPLF